MLSVTLRRGRMLLRWPMGLRSLWLCALMLAWPALGAAQTAPGQRVLELRYTPAPRAQIAFGSRRAAGQFIEDSAV